MAEALGSAFTTIKLSDNVRVKMQTAELVHADGTPTAGANGDVTNTVLPGNIVVTFSGHNVRHADGRQLQRLGIQPTIKVAPTIKGLVEGKDEILEAAVNFLQSKR